MVDWRKALYGIIKEWSKFTRSSSTAGRSTQSVAAKSIKRHKNRELRRITGFLIILIKEDQVMIEYSLNGAWGKTIPDDKLKEALADFGVELDVEARRDGLTNVRIKIDDEKILKRKKRSSVRKSSTADVAKKVEKAPAKKTTRKASR